MSQDLTSIGTAKYRKYDNMPYERLPWECQAWKCSGPLMKEYKKEVNGS